MRLTSTMFANGGTIPIEAAHPMCGGKNVSPDLEWSDVPDGTKSFVVLCHDPDAPTGTGFYHWILFNIPGTVRKLDRGMGTAENPQGGKHGHTDWGDKQYGGPCPPPGRPHHYNFTLYALSVDKLDLDENTTGAKLRFMIRDKTLASATLTGLFGT